MYLLSLEMQTREEEGWKGPGKGLAKRLPLLTVGAVGVGKALWALHVARQRKERGAREPCPSLLLSEAEEEEEMSQLSCPSVYSVP